MLNYNILDEALNFFVDDFLRGTSSLSKRGDFPKVEVYEGSDEVEIRAIVPGIAVGDLDIQLENNNLVISGEKKNDHAEGTYIKKERLFGKFSKTVRLPYRVNPENINAELKNGILLVKLTKSEEAKPKKIQIN